MYTALALDASMRAKGMKSTFRATGQTGILITGHGVPLDAVIADFMAGSIEYLTPDNDDDHWDIIEGQGAFFHPAYAGVCVSLIHGSQPDAMVLCHEPLRKTLLGHEDFSVPTVPHCINAYELIARLTNPEAKVIAVSLNSNGMTNRQYLAAQQSIRELTGLPCFDPIRDGADVIVELLKS